MPTVAINGLGRIGRAALKILLDSDGLELAAVNDIAAADNLAYLLNYDTVYGRYHRKVSAEDGALVVDGLRIPVFAERDPGALPWSDLGVDLVLECTGVFTTEEDLSRHIRAGASYVILSAPTKSQNVPTVVHGVNRPDGQPRIISCASCTTNCITPVIETAHRRIGVERAVMTKLYAAVAELFPEAVLEDASLDGECGEVLRGEEGRLSFDAPIHSAADVQALPVQPGWMNIKPSRFGKAERLLQCIEYCDANGIKLYGGGQFELGGGRMQIQSLASLFYPDGPNDIAPSDYNTGAPRPGLPQSPLPPPSGIGF